jgi:hypothetical protein
MDNKPLRIAGRIIAILNLLNILNSTWYFLAVAKFSPSAWLAFNACTPSVLLFLTGYLLKKNPILSASLPFLLFFGTTGLFVFGWTGTSLFAQIGHISMTLAAAWIVFYLIREHKRFPSIAGLSAGLVLFLLILPLQQNYVRSHPDYLKQLGDPTFERLMDPKAANN